MTDKKPLNYGRDSKGKFTQGNKLSQGKPKGSRHKTTQAAQILLDDESQALTRKAIELALDGDLQALRLCLERICPPSREHPLPEIVLPTVNTTQDLPKLTAAILEAASRGELLPSQAQALTNIVAAHGRILELTELEARLTALEAANNE